MRAARLAAVALALAMLGYRLVGLGDAPFVRDEPFFLEAARQQLLTGHWVLGSPIVGGQGIPYGPSVMWFYGAVQRVLGPSPVVCIGAMCLLCSLASLALAWALTRLFRRGPFFFATVLAFIASSPYGFFWSRFAWDQLVFALSALAVALCCARTISWQRGLVLGLVLGLAISSHLMVAPLVLLIGLILAVEHRREVGALVRFGGATLAAAVLVNVPYLIFLSRATVSAGVASEESHGLLVRALQPARAASLWHIEYFFDRDWPHLLASLGLERSWAPIAVVSLVMCAALALLGIIVLIVRGERNERRVGLLAAATACGYALFYATKLLPLEPHYQFATWWLVPVGVAGALVFLPARAAQLAHAVVWVLALGQMAFIVAATRYVHAEAGTRGVHYGPPVAHQAALVRDLCAGVGPGETMVIFNQTNVFRGSLEYLSHIEPRCADRTLRLCRACPPTQAGARRLQLSYRGVTGGALTVTEATSIP